MRPRRAQARASKGRSRDSRGLPRRPGLRSTPHWDPYPAVRTTHLFLGLSPLALLAACGSSSDSNPNDPTTIQGLSGPGAISIVTADESNVSTGGGGGGAAGLSWPAGSDFLTDAARVHVYDPSMQALSQRNEILCIVGMTAYDEMVNQGAYVALVDEEICSTGQALGRQRRVLCSGAEPERVHGERDPREQRRPADQSDLGPGERPEQHTGDDQRPDDRLGGPLRRQPVR